MTEVRKLVLVLTIALLIVSMFLAVSLLDTARVNVTPGKSSSTQSGEIRLNIVPQKTHSSATGYIGLTILPSE